MDINERIEWLEHELEILKSDMNKESNVWKPKINEAYFIITNVGRVEELTNFFPSELDKRLSIGNVFQSREEAEFAIEKLKVEKELKKYAEPFDSEKTQWKINYGYEDDIFYKVWERDVASQGTFYFDSPEMIQKAIEAIGEDRIKKYILNV